MPYMVDPRTVRGMELLDAIRTYCDVDPTWTTEQIIGCDAFAVSDELRCQHCGVATATAVVQDCWDGFARLCGLCIYKTHGA